MKNLKPMDAVAALYSTEDQELAETIVACLSRAVFHGSEIRVAGKLKRVLANLSYRVTALYSGLDSVLGMSAGLKHFGKRRLGRSGLDDPEDTPDKIWDVDCSPLFKDYRESIHSAYFHVPACYDLMKQIMKGLDRQHIETAAIKRR